MIGSVISWWLVSSLLGLAAFPLAWRLFHKLPDRGFGLSRSLGILAASYGLWLGATAGVWRNDLGGAVGVVILLALVSMVVSRGRWGSIVDWISENRRPLLVMEAVFALAFVVWAFVRANDPRIDHTEQTMDMMYLNGILSSETFPPRDPWLSGYAISYYYFGYVSLAVLTRLSGINPTVGYNLGNALWFALTSLGAYSLLYDLLASRRRGRPIAVSLLGPLFVVLSGNLEGFLEFLHARHVFWRKTAEGVLQSGFWRWLDLQDLSQPPAVEPLWGPTRTWWWWRASRVIHDTNLSGRNVELIDEFPFFSFLLADNHPHLLALPFVLLAIAFALQVFLNQDPGEHRFGRLKISDGQIKRIKSGALIALAGFVAVVVLKATHEASSTSGAFLSAVKGVVLGSVGLGLFAGFSALLTGILPSSLPKEGFWFAAWLFGGLAFLNTWDFPIYLSLLMGVLWWVGRATPTRTLLIRLGSTGLGLLVAGLLFYLPWYPTFTSQAGGILPNLIFTTRVQQFLVMFGTSFVPILVWLIDRAKSRWKSDDTGIALRVGLGVPAILFSLLILLAGGLYFALVRDPNQLQVIMTELGLSDVPLGRSLPELTKATLTRHFARLPTVLTLGMVLGLGVALLSRAQAPPKVKGSKSGKRTADDEGPWPFVVLMIAIGALLVLGPEFLYLKDLFSTRMNTVFKIYFATWILWGLAGAYATVELWPRRWASREALRSLVVVPLFLGLFYPVMATQTKTDKFNLPSGRTLDGAAYLAQNNPADYDAILWINDQGLEGVIAEAVGGSYTYYGRISTFTGLSTVLGWGGHESQWRGKDNPLGSRQDDIAFLYQTSSWTDAQSVLDRYDIDYVYVGPLERTTYRPLVERKFDTFLKVIYRSGEVTIYGRRDEARG